MAYYGTVFVLSLYLQRVHGDSALRAGLAFLPLTGGFLVSNVASGWVVARCGPRLPMMIGAAIGALGYAGLQAVQADTPFVALLVPFLLIPAGMGLAVPAMTTAVLASVDPQRAGTASAVLNTARQAGGAVGVGLCIGASLDFLTGRKARAPLWMRKASLEWLHRLLSEPRRLWRRYLVEGPRIFVLTMRWRRGG